MAVETVKEISSGEDDLLIVKPKKVKLEKEENVTFIVKTIPGDSHCIANCFSMFFGKDSSEILSLLWNEFQENIHLDHSHKKRKHGPNRPFFLYNLSSENY